MSTEEKTGTAQPPIRITEQALAEIRRLMQAQDMPATTGVRVGVRGGGCSGYSYTLSFDSEQRPDDHVVVQDGVRLYCDPKSLGYLAGTTLDYTDGLAGRGFQFMNPNATGTCGCGESFSV